MARVTGASVEWFEGFGNAPGLIIEVDALDGLIRRDDPIWRHVRVADGWWVIAEKRLELPTGWHAEDHDQVSWVHLDDRPAPSGGALGGTWILQDGTQVKSPGGWSSRAGAVNQLREELGLAEEVVDVIYRERQSLTGRAGHCTRTVALAAVGVFCLGVNLLRVTRFGGEPYYIPSIRPTAITKPNGKTVERGIESLEVIL